MNVTVVLFRDEEDVGLVADNVEVLEDTETQVVLTATFVIAPDVEDVLAEANKIMQSNVKKVSATGTAEGQVVRRLDGGDFD